MTTTSLGVLTPTNDRRAAVALTPDELGEIERAAAQITIQGARYPESQERLTNR